MLIRLKFGGSSLADLEKLRRAAELCLDARRRGHDIVAVVSAMGDTTDDLLDLAHQIAPAPSPRELDALLTTGEQQSAALLAIMLESMGQSARSFTGWQAGIFTSGSHGDARIALMLPARLRSALNTGHIAVVSGFQGIDGAGDISTLGRGGSDTTAVALAAAMDADRCMIYTDVDGIYTADPRLVENADFLPEIDYIDMLRLARAGSQVLHSRSVELAMEYGVEIRLLSSLTGTGGSIVTALPEEERPKAAGVTRDAAVGLVTLVGREVDAGTLSALVLMLAKAGVEVLSGRAEEGAVSVKVAPEQLLPALRLIHAHIFG